MPYLLVRVGDVVHRIRFSSGQPVRDALDVTDFRVRSACNGLGACGLCRIRIIEGNGGEATANERYHIPAAERQRGVRLACQVRPEEDLTIEIVAPAPKSHWKSPPFALFPDRIQAGAGLRPTSVPVEQPLGLAVDVGTTNLSLSLFELQEERWLAERWGPNPQAEFGADVISRLTAAAASREVAGELSLCVVQAIRDGLWDIAVREGFNLQSVARVTLVGNTAMLALLAGRNYERLLQPASWTEPIDCSPPDTTAWVQKWCIHPQAEVEVVAPLAGFVGSDLIAGLLATGLVEEAAPALLVDFGTNSEIALWNGSALWVTAAAGGPAFESSGISHGMPAESGAVFRVNYDADADRFEYGILGDMVAKGICGSGLVDLVAVLRRSGRLTATGRLLEARQAVPRFAFSVGGKSLALTTSDVDALQRAKAAIATGILELSARAGVVPQDLKRVCVAGAFGHYLDVNNAEAIGLLPPVPAERVQLTGNTALAGCRQLLLYEAAATRAEHLRTTATLINLAQSSDFDVLFLAGLYLEPLTSPQGASGGRSHSFCGDNRK